MGLPKKLHASQQLRTHTPDLRFTLNTQRKRQVSLHLSLNFSLRLAPPLSPHRDLCGAIAPVSRIQIIASSYSPPGNEHNNKVTRYPHVLFALIPPPLIGFTCSHNQLIHHPKFSSPLHLSLPAVHFHLCKPHQDSPIFHLCPSFLFKPIHTLTTFCFTTFLYSRLLTSIFLYPFHTHLSAVTWVSSYSGRVEDFFARGNVVSSF